MELLNYLNQGRGKRMKLARAINAPPILISQWANKKRRVPAERCPDIERATEGAVRCEVLRPDIDWAVLRRPELKEGEHAQEVSHG